jgi:hypothetical protein
VKKLNQNWLWQLLDEVRQGPETERRRIVESEYRVRHGQ